VRNPFRIFWGIVAMGAIIAYLSHGVSLTAKPEAMTWEEFSRNPQAMSHFAERHGLSWRGTAKETQVMREVFERNVTHNPEFTRTPAIQDDGDSHNFLVARMQRAMRAAYQCWQPKQLTHQASGFHFSALWQLRWNIGMTIGVLLGLILICTTGITLFERKAGV
jgi:hypothetical protein